MRFLSSEALQKDKRNHCIPLLEVLRPLGEDKDDVQLLVMPYARPVLTPRFDTVGEVVQCIRGVLEVHVGTLLILPSVSDYSFSLYN